MVKENVPLTLDRGRSYSRFGVVTVAVTVIAHVEQSKFLEIHCKTHQLHILGKVYTIEFDTEGNASISTETSPG